MVYVAAVALEQRATNSLNTSLDQTTLDRSMSDSGDIENRCLPVPYVLPHFPRDIQRLLDTEESQLAVSSSYRCKIRKAITDDMAGYTL